MHHCVIKINKEMQKKGRIYTYTHTFCLKIRSNSTFSNDQYLLIFCGMCQADMMRAWLLLTGRMNKILLTIFWTNFSLLFSLIFTLTPSLSLPPFVFLLQFYEYTCEQNLQKILLFPKFCCGCPYEEKKSKYFVLPPHRALWDTKK